MSAGGTIRDDPTSRSSAEVPRLPHLFVVLECGRPLAGGASLRIEGVEEVVLGRGATRGAALQTENGRKRIALTIPDGRMSQRHASIARTKEGWVLSDLGSTNGTFVEGERADRELLGDGATFELGSTIFLLRTALPAEGNPRLFVESSALPHRQLGLATLMPAHAAAVASLAKIAAADISVLILGESGTGKEVTARAVHQLSKRSGAFVPVNCGALPETLLESQLFGHVKGAFSGAAKDEVGLVRASDHGTLFLDEIGDMRAPSQVALLRLVQEREVTPVGATKPVPVALRVVAATHRQVDGLEAAGFRSDLYARVAGYTHRLPPLRSRIADLGLLVGDLLKRLAPDREDLTIAIDLARAMVSYEWPLNVRELEQTLRVTSLLAEDGVLRLAHAPETLRASLDERKSDEPVSHRDREVREALIAALSAHQGNVSKVATEMGRTRMQIHRWMRKFGIEAGSYRGGR
jgi:DNA-binding NtrC family response regulator